MSGLEKVIKGIDICLQRFHCGKDCPYYNDAKIGCEEQLREDALELLKEQPQIVRCKDCKYWNSNLGEYCEKINGYPGAEWFCANGERQEGR